ncbi:MAG: insulinase family protein [Kofleriaceae bacterium]|nr:insulinase family protein [Kofleriaceae bacterium]
MPVVAMRAVWPGGTRLETDATSGTTALLASTVTRGCGARDAAEVADVVDRLAGGVVGVGGRNSFGVRAEWLARTWDDGLDVFLDCALAPRLDDDEVARQRRLLLDDLDARATSGSHQAFRLFAETLYRHHPYRLDPLGSPDAVAAMDGTSLRGFWRDHYPASTMTLAIVGDVDPEQVLRRIRDRFADVTAAAPVEVTVAAETFEDRPAADREVYGYLAREQAHVVIGFPGTTVTAEDRFAVEVLAAVLGGQGGRLFAELRERRALAYRVSAFAVDGVDPGYLAIYVSCSPDKVDEAVAAIRAQIDALVADGVDAAEVRRTARALAGSHAVAMQRRAAMANALAFHDAYGLGWQGWADYPDRLRAVTAADVDRVAATYLRWDVAVTATVRPPAETDGARKRARGVRKKAPRPRPASHHTRDRRSS